MAVYDNSNHYRRDSEYYCVQTTDRPFRIMTMYVAMQTFSTEYLISKACTPGICYNNELYFKSVMHL